MDGRAGTVRPTAARVGKLRLALGRLINGRLTTGEELEKYGVREFDQTVAVEDARAPWLSQALGKHRTQRLQQERRSMNLNRALEQPLFRSRRNAASKGTEQ